MALGQGYKSKAAFKIETGSWGSAIACGVQNQINIISESVSPSIDQQGSVHLQGNAGARTLYPILKKYQGDLLIEAHYSGIEALLSCALGMSHQNLSPVNTSTSAYEHYIEPSDDMSGRAFNGYEMTTPSGNVYRRGTLCLEKDVSIWELSSTMINSVSFEANPERCTWTFNVASRFLDFDTSTNAASTTWSFPANNSQVLFDDMVVYLKARDSFTITSANDNFIIDDGGGDITLDIADGTYTGYELAQKIANAANAHASVSGSYEMEYDEETRRFRIYTTDGQTFSVTGTSMDMATTVGMTVDSASGVETFSNFDAVPDAYAAFDSGDQVGVSSFSFSIENNLDVESQDSESDLYIIEPERNAFRRVTGQIEIPRYKNDTFLKAANGFTTYEMHVKFTGSAIDSESEEYNFYFPAIKFTNVGAPISGPELIKQTLAFEAQTPTIIDPQNFVLSDYNFLTTATCSNNIYCAASFIDGLYVGCDGGLIKKWIGNGWSTSTDLGSNVTYSLQMYEGKLYAGTDGGTIYEFDGNTWSSSTDVGSGAIKSLVRYGDNLYALEGATGKIHVTSSPVSSTSWSTSCDTTSTDAKKLVVYNGNLYMTGDDGSTFVRVYAFDGTTWSISTDMAFDDNHTIAVHRNKLYSIHADDIEEYNGTKWINIEGSLGFDCVDAISYKGNLLLYQTGGTEVLAAYDISGDAPVTLVSGIFTTPTMMAIYEDNLFLAHTTTNLKIFKPIQEIMVTVQNSTSTNRL